MSRAKHMSPVQSFQSPEEIGSSTIQEDIDTDRMHNRTFNAARPIVQNPKILAISAIVL